MAGMIEQVARALCIHSGKDPDSIHPLNPALKHWRLFVGKARCAIAAMREPTEAQYEALSATGEMWRDLNSRTVWQTYIDAAINDDAQPLTG